MKTGKIEKSTFKSEWNNPKGGLLYYHDLVLEGDSTVWNIGAQSKEPDFLAVGQTLTYEITDPAKKKIKRVKEAPQSFAGGGKPFDSAGVTIGNAISNATLLVCHGKVDEKQLEATARRIAEIAFKLKEEFAGR